MSNKKEATRLRILDSALKMLRERGPGAVTMADVAQQAGLTRQAVYVHFGSRTALMLALVDHIDEVSGLQEFLGPVRSAATGHDALDASLRMIARYSPRIHDVATAIDLARHTDADAAAAWNDRMKGRRKSIGRIVRRLQREGALRPEFSVAQAIDAIWALSLPHTYAALVVERGWSLEDYERLLMALAGALVLPKPPARPHSARSKRADRR